MNVGFVGYMVIMGQGSPNSIFGSNKCQLVSFQIRKHLYWLLRQFVHWFVHERHFRILTIQMGTPPPSRFPCCVLSYFSLVFVMEHNWQIQVIKSQLSRAINYLCPQLLTTSRTHSLLTFLFPCTNIWLYIWLMLFPDRNRWNKSINENLGIHWSIFCLDHFLPPIGILFGYFPPKISLNIFPEIFSFQIFPLINIFPEIFSFQIFPLVNIFPEIFSFQIFCARRSQEWVYRGDKRENNSLHPWQTPS